MGRRRTWGLVLIGAGALWLVGSALLLMWMRASSATPLPSGEMRVVMTLVPSLLLIGGGAFLLLRARTMQTAELRRTSLEDVRSALLRHDAVTVREIAEELDLPGELVHEIVAELVERGQIAGYIEPTTGKIHVTEPTRVLPGACPACGSPTAGTPVTCPQCGMTILRPGL